ncbi:unnamed protein product [Echinostoma caproni]|uniref:Protein kinase domain-containing protein n=1 Tax=Echinostoma caproni TaxID=27848 RepID=A0A183A6G3_9TREM|nr:unnamed protein product [Echinostoma caproni]
MQPGPDSLSPLWQKYSTVFSPNSLDHAHVLHQRTTPLQFLVDHFRNQLIKEQVSAVRNLDCAIASPGSMAHPHLMDGDVRHRFRSRVSNISMETMHDSATHHHLPSFVSPDTPQVDGMPFPCLPLLQQINKIFPGLIHQTSAKSVMGTEKALFVPPNPNILGHLAYLHRLAMTVFMHQNNPDTSNTGITNDNHFLNHSSTVDLSIPTLDADRVMSDQTANASSSSSTSSSSTITPTAALSTNSITTVSSEIASIRIKTDLQPGEQNSLFGHPGTGLNLTVASSKSLEAKGHLISSSKSGFPLYSKGDDLHRNDNGLERNAFGYPFPDFDSILLRHRPSILPNHDLWASSLGKPIHQMLPAPLPIHQGKKFGCRASDGALPAQENLHESTFNLVEAPRVVRLSNCSLKPIDQLTVSDFVASALHPTASGHASPVAASLTEALLNQCGLELSWVKLAHIRERPGSQTIRLLFNVSSKRHRLPVGTTERIQGRHSSRMLWPQFSGKSFKVSYRLHVVRIQ